jgi:hypothetical protein
MKREILYLLMSFNLIWIPNSHNMLLKWKNILFPEFKINNFSLVTDNNEFIWEADTELVSKQNYGCGCFWFVKK